MPLMLLTRNLRQCCEMAERCGKFCVTQLSSGLNPQNCDHLQPVFPQGAFSAACHELHLCMDVTKQWTRHKYKTRGARLQKSTLKYTSKSKIKKQRSGQAAETQKGYKEHACKIAELNKCTFQSLTSGCGASTKCHIVYETELVQGILAHFFFSCLFAGAHECAKALALAFATFAFKSCPWVFSRDLNCHVRNARSHKKRSNHICLHVQHYRCSRH